MLTFALISDCGNRAVNEDAVKVASVANKNCFVVCDGLGGHDRGDVASKLVANTFVENFYFADDLKDFLLHSFNRAQKCVVKMQEENGLNSKMKTTAVVFVTDENSAYVGHIGDSRFYGFTKSGQYIRTQDHSVPQILANANTITEKDIRNHPSRNMLLKVIGEQYDETMAEVSASFPLEDYCAFLLCSDGFWELICEEDMLRLLQTSTSAQDWLDRMVQLVRQNGAKVKMDNYSAIAILNT